MARSAFLAAFLLSASVPSVYGTEGGCLVEKYRHLTNPAETRIRSLIRLDTSLTFVVEFEGHDLSFWRDRVELTNSRVTHGKVRDGKSSSTTHDLPLLVSEGWNIFLLKAVGESFNLALLFGHDDDDEAPLLDLGLDFHVSSVHVEGTFSLCSEEIYAQTHAGSFEWEVAAGKEVSIPLQPKSNQKLQVTGQDDAAPYLVMPPSSSKPPVKISSNTTLTIVTRRRRSVIQVEVFQTGIKEALADMEQPLASPTVQMGSHAGTLHLRLDLSAPPPTATKNCHSADSSGDSKALWPMGFVLLFGGIAFGCLLGVTVALLVSRQMARRATTSGAAASLSECEVNFLPDSAGAHTIKK